MEFSFSYVGKPAEGPGLLGGKSRISVLEKLSLKMLTRHPCGVAEKAASFVKQKQKIGQLTCRL